MFFIKLFRFETGASPSLRDHIRGLTGAEWATLCGRHMCAEIIRRSALNEQEVQSDNGNCTKASSSLVYNRTMSNVILENSKFYSTRIIKTEAQKSKT